ncbi:TetR/AcrR family transcriptional regulator [Mesorhizobium sp. UC22_110]|uniref:TetR/AcrR family transcriptional regulator n=1 Tax=Mesorhizobium sp. UC22_110 TaxID=3374552 RepID=UPI003757A776
MKQPKPTAAGSQLRRRPKQERSRERIDAILATAKRLIGEKGIDAVTMKEVGALAGGPIATVYHYFPNKSAILATLYERFSEVTRTRQRDIAAGIDGLESMIAASDRMLDDYYERVAGDPAILICSMPSRPTRHCRISTSPKHITRRTSSATRSSIC